MFYVTSQSKRQQRPNKYVSCTTRLGPRLESASLVRYKVGYFADRSLAQNAMLSISICLYTVMRILSCVKLYSPSPKNNFDMVSDRHRSAAAALLGAFLLLAQTQSLVAAQCKHGKLDH